MVRMKASNHPGNAGQDGLPVLLTKGHSVLLWARLRRVRIRAFSAPSAAGGHGLTRYKAGVVGQKELHDAGDLFWFADPTHRRDRNQMFNKIGVGRLSELRIRQPWSDTVHADVVRGKRFGAMTRE